MNASIWNLLHDGSIVQISGSLPGQIQVAVDIEYLRQRFCDPGDWILLTLYDCTAISYQPWDCDQIVTDLATIAAAEPEILSADEPTIVLCVSGILRVDATDFSIALDSGRTLTLEELSAASEAYWNELQKLSSSEIQHGSRRGIQDGY